VSFKRKDLHGQETLGERMRVVREESGQSLDEAALGTGIQAKYLAALEASDYRSLPGPVYARAFLKRYAEYLTLNPELALRRFDEEQRVVAPLSGTHRFSPVRAGVPRAVFTPTLWRRVGAGFIILVVLGYLGLELTRFVVAPALTVTEPPDNLRTTEPVITVAGQTTPESTLRLNGQEVSIATDGTFRETLTLSPGVNTILFQVNRKRSRTRTVTRHVLRDIPVEPATPPPAS
jgi:cytoskeletal protein RodZ